MKIVINGCYGGFSLSEDAVRHMADAGSERAKAEIAEYEEQKAAIQHYALTGNLPASDEPEHHTRFTKSMFDIDIKYRDGVPKFHGFGYVEGFDGAYERNDPLLVAAVEALGERANGECSSLRVVEVPDGVDWEIDEYDGLEHIAEKHRTWS